MKRCTTLRRGASTRGIARSLSPRSFVPARALRSSEAIAPARRCSQRVCIHAAAVGACGSAHGGGFGGRTAATARSQRAPIARLRGRTGLRRLRAHAPRAWIRPAIAFSPARDGGNGVSPARGGGRVRRGRQDHEGTGSAGDVVVRGRPVKAGPARSGRSFSGGGVAAREGARGERAGPLRQNTAPRARVMFARGAAWAGCVDGGSGAVAAVSRAGSAPLRVLPAALSGRMAGSPPWFATGHTLQTGHSTQ